MECLGTPSLVGEVIVFQPSWLPESEQQNRLPYRLVPIVSALMNAGYGVRLLEEAVGDRPAPGWKSWLDDSSAAIVWCSEMYPGHQIRGILEFLSIARGTRATVVAGGGFFPLLDLSRLRLDPILRAILVGPGEATAPRVVAAIRAGEALESVPGVVAFADGRARGARVGAPIGRHVDRDGSALESLSLASRTHSEPRIFGNLDPAIQVLTASGCAKRCPFCFDERTPYRPFGADAAVSMIDMACRRAEVRQVLMGELDFFHSRTRALAIANGVLALDRRIAWFALGSVADLVRLGDDDLATLAKSGCVRIELGSESGADSALRRLGKRHAASQIRETVSRLVRHGIATTHNLLFGIPEESESERRATIELAFDLRSLDPRARFNLRLFQVVPATTFGESILAGREDSFPNTLEALRDYRQDALVAGRLLPWLPATDEDWIKSLVGHVLPLALGEQLGDRPPAMLRWYARHRAIKGLRSWIDFEHHWLEQRRDARVCDTYVA